MNLFHEIAGAQVIITSRGVYQQVPAFRKGKQVYAKYGSGFVRLLGGSGTTAPQVSWQEISVHGCIENRGSGVTPPKWIGADTE